MGLVGNLRVLRFATLADRIYVKTYSPYVDEYETDSDSQFWLSYDMLEVGREYVGAMR